MNTSFLEQVTALVITYNEAANIDRTLGKLAGAKRIVVVDSGSDDGTQDIVARHARTEIVVRPFDTFAGQCNFGLAEGGIDTEWVLSLDADYVLSDEVVAEIADLAPADDVDGYRVRFRYAVYGRPIRCGVYPPVVVLFRKAKAHYVQDGHAHRVVVTGRVDELTGLACHDDRKPLSRWLESQRVYARREAVHLEEGSVGPSRWRDRIRRWPGVAPVLMFAYVYFVRGGILDGRRGLYYALQRAYAELLLSLEVIDRRLRAATDR